MNKNNYNSIEFRSIRGFLRTVFSNECYICKESKNLMECHHIDNNSKNNNIFNLVLLCLECHKIVHKSQFNSLNYRKVLIDRITNFLAGLIERNIKDLKVIDKYDITEEVKTEKSYAFGHPLSDD